MKMNVVLFCGKPWQANCFVKTRATGDGTPRQRVHDGSPREADRSLRHLRNPAVPDVKDALREGHFMDRSRLQDEIVAEFVVPAATDEVLVAARNQELSGP
jgi:hypothetical protein